jgi:hypothetical protein
LGPFRTAVSHFRRFAFRVSLSQFRDAPFGWILGIEYSKLAWLLYS